MKSRAKIPMKFFTFLFIFLNASLNCVALLPGCLLHQMHLQKIIGFRPPVSYFAERNFFNRHFGHNASAYGTTTSARCWSLCDEQPACVAYVHLLDSDECYGFSYFKQPHLPLAEITGELPLLADPDAIYYEKACLNVPEDCVKRKWSVTKIPGASLLDQSRKTLETLVTRRECAERCFYEREFKCLSASFSPTYRNNQQRLAQTRAHAGRALSHQAPTQPQSLNTLGFCALSDRDKLSQPDAYRAAPFDEEYIENQCHERAVEDETCSYEVFANSTFAYSESHHYGLNEKECQMRCTHERLFNCLGATFQYLNNDRRHSVCALHSEDILSMGPRSLRYREHAVYMRRVKCLDVQVHCTRDEMSVRYTPRDAFYGRLYVSQHSKSCVAYGNGTSSSILRLAIGSEIKENRCGILRAYEMTRDYQRTFISALVVIQNHESVQTQSDRLIKVGCIISNTTATTTMVPDASALRPTSTATSSPWLYAPNELPRLSLRIVDLPQQRVTDDVQLGQELELQIIAEPAADFRMLALTAKTNDEQNLVRLIDDRGCATDDSVFPAFTQIRTASRNMLTARFRAFKFAGSTNVNFNATVLYCVQPCAPVDCLSGNSIQQPTSAQRRSRRQTNDVHLLRVQNPIYIATVVDIVHERPLNESRPSAVPLVDELALSYQLHVHGPDAAQLNGNALVQGERGVLLIAGINYPLLGGTDDYCLNRSLLFAVLIFCIIFQILLVCVCIALLYKYRRLAKADEERRQLQEEYLESRRVHWADQNNGFTF